MSFFTISVISLVSGILASLGLGGGMVLIVWLTLFEGIHQLEAQGINLIFFIPIAIAALIMHCKNHFVDWKKAVPIIISGVFAAIIASYFANKINSDTLKRIFGIFVIITGLKEFFTKEKNNEKTKQDV